MLKLATSLATEAGRISLDRIDHVSVRRKADNSVVTETDHAIQELILDAVAKDFPDHAVAAEETVANPGRHVDRQKARYCWAIDPLDGTRNYVAGFPCFATSIGVLDRGRPVVAVVTEHNLGHTYTAVINQGAFLDGQPIHANKSIAGRDVLVGIPSSKSTFAVSVLREWVARPGLITRNVGSTALHLAMVASGVLDAAFSTIAKIWDIAAGALLITEAGGCVTHPSGEDPFPFTADTALDTPIPVLVGCRELHGRLLESTGKFA